MHEVKTMRKKCNLNLSFLLETAFVVETNKKREDLNRFKETIFYLYYFIL